MREGAATSAPAIKLVNSLLARAIEEGASDIHFEPQAKRMVVRARIDGVMRRLDDGPEDASSPPSRAASRSWASSTSPSGALPQDGRVSIRFGGTPMDLRIAMLPTTYGEKVALRILHRAKGRLGLTELGLSPTAEGPSRGRSASRSAP